MVFPLLSPTPSRGARLPSRSPRSSSAFRFFSALALLALISSTLLWGASDLRAAVTFDAVSSTTGTGSSSATLTFAHTVTSSGSSRILVVSVAVLNAASNAQTISGVTYGGQALSQPASCTFTNGNNSHVSMWYKLDPLTGANNVVVSFSGATSSVVVAGAHSFYYVSQVAPVCGGGAQQSSGTPASVAITAAVGDVVIDTAATEVAPIWWTLNHCVVWRSIPACCRAFHLPSYSAGLR